MKKLLMIIYLIPLLTVGCTSNNNQEKIGIRGNITSIYLDGENATILVEGKLEKDTNYNEAYVNITKDTKIEKDDTDELLKPYDLELGFIVEVTFEGDVQETSPVKGTAKSIKIIN